MKYFLTSDCHFDDENILKVCNRPFKSVDHMNDELARRWNERVKDEDMVFHIGDFGFDKGYKWYPKLKGQKYLIRGNHDKNNHVKALVDTLTFTIANKSFYLAHDPERYNGDYDFNLVGHVHGAWKFRKRFWTAGQSTFVPQINVGVDVWNFYPVTIEEALREFQKWMKQTEK